MSYNNHWGESTDVQHSLKNGQQVLGPEPAFRSGKDRLLNGPATSQYNYPDGYLSGPNSRRQGRLNPVYRRNARPYERGIHSGSKVNPAAYIWPDEFHPFTGLQHEAAGKQWAPTMIVEPTLTANGRVGPRQVPNPLNRPALQEIDPQRRALLLNDLPTWK